MKIYTTTSVFPPKCDPCDTLPRLTRAGFTGLDLAFDYCTDKDSPFMSEGYCDWAKRLNEKAKEHGADFLYSHAPFNAEETDTSLIERTFVCSQILGIKYTVVHPTFRKRDGTYYETTEEFIEVNLKNSKRLAEIGEKYGVTVLSENLLWGASIRPQAISDLVKAVDSEYFGWCYDTGHANAFGINWSVLEDVEILPLSLHIQDNHGKGDEHLLPGDGNIDWEDFMRVLKRSGYKGEFVLEAHRQCIALPDEERDGLLKDLYARAERLVSFYDTL